MVDMNMIRSTDHELFSIQQHRIGLSPLENKSYHFSMLESLRYGHEDIAKRQEEVDYDNMFDIEVEV